MALSQNQTSIIAPYCTLFGAKVYRSIVFAKIVPHCSMLRLTALKSAVLRATCFPDKKIASTRRVNQGKEKLEDFTHIRQGNKLINLSTGEVEHVFECNRQSIRLGENFLDDIQEVVDCYKDGKFIDGKAFYPPRYYRKRLQVEHPATSDVVLGRYDRVRFGEVRLEYIELGQQLGISYEEFRSALIAEATRKLTEIYSVRSLD